MDASGADGNVGLFEPMVYISADNVSGKRLENLDLKNILKGA